MTGIIVSFVVLWIGCLRSDRFAFLAIPIFTVGWLVGIVLMGMQ